MTAYRIGVNVTPHETWQAQEARVTASLAAALDELGGPTGDAQPTCEGPVTAQDDERVERMRLGQWRSPS